MRSVAILLLTAASVFAAVDGTVVNKTTGKPQAGVSVSLIKPGQGGMRTLGTAVSGASGRFSFQADEPGGGPQLLQASYAGVNYNKLLTPNVPTSGVELDIYDSTASANVAHVSQRMLILEPSLSQINCNETIVIQNDTNRTYNNPAVGGIRFYLPPASNGQVRVQAQGPQGMPLPRAAEKTNETDVFKVDFPIKPGQTEFEILYNLPAGSPFTFQGRVVNIKGMTAGPLRLVVPQGVTLSGKDVQQLGTEPNTQATIYNVLSSGGFSADISGTGSLHNGSNENAAGDNSESPPLTEGTPRIYAHLPWLLGLAFAVLALGMVLLYRSSPVRS